jgi:hypothetical protein
MRATDGLMRDASSLPAGMRETDGLMRDASSLFASSL